MNTRTEASRLTPARPLLTVEEHKLLESKPAPMEIDDGSTTRMIAEAAYYRAKKRGFLPGYELDDWLTAEAEIRAMAIAAT